MTRAGAVAFVFLFAISQAALGASVQWMHADAGSKSVSFDITEGAQGEGSGLNFNGYAQGHMTITVPQGWKVTMHVVNQDSLPHSLEVAPAQSAPPIDSVPPAFPRAETIDLKQGMPTGKRDTVTFNADKAGRYWIMCAVPGHAQGGMWDWLVVSDSVKAPNVDIASQH